MKVITSGRLGKEFYEHYKENDLGVKVKYVEELNQQDIDWADGLVSFAPKEEVNLKDLQWIHCFGAGVESYLNINDLNAELLLSRTVGDLGSKMGEFCLTHLLNYFQNFYTVRVNQSEKKWEQHWPKSVKAKNVLLLGAGEMAKGISSVLKTVEMTTIGVNRNGNPNKGFDQCIAFDDVQSIAGDVDAIINTLPHTKHTEGLLSKSFFNRFQNVLFINVGRGKTVNTSDLKFAISNGNCAYAVLDVFEEEPLPKSSDLWTNEKIIITPHQSALTDIHDVILSFEAVFHSIQNQEENALFVDIKKGY